MEYKPCIIALQQTKFNEKVPHIDIISKEYTLLLKSNARNYWQHGTGLAIKAGIPFEQIHTDADIEAIIVRIHLPFPVTVVSLHIPPSNQQCHDALNTLLEQLSGPVIVLGDFNVHHPAWGSSTSNPLGRFIAEKTLMKQLIILNDGIPTRIDLASGTTSAIDLSICSETLASKLTWKILSDTYNSDHFPLLLTIPGWSQTTLRKRKWLYNIAFDQVINLMWKHSPNIF